MTCGSVVKLKHTSSNYRLHSHEVSYGNRSVACVIASSRNNTSRTVYLSACNPNADFFVWETNDYSPGSSFASNNDHSFSELGGEVKFAIDYVKSLTGATKVQLVGHSMGGIAARHYLQNSTAPGRTSPVTWQRS